MLYEFLPVNQESIQTIIIDPRFIFITAMKFVRVGRSFIFTFPICDLRKLLNERKVRFTVFRLSFLAASRFETEIFA